MVVSTAVAASIRLPARSKDRTSREIAMSSLFSTHSIQPVVRFAMAFAVCLAFASSTPVQGQDKVTFDDHIKPIFRSRCASCHNPDNRKGDLDVTNYTNLMQGGSSGEVVEAGDAMISTLYLLVTHEDEPKMPPNADKIPAGEIDLIGKWINGGLLENKGSKAKVSDRPKLDMAVEGNANERPANPVMPVRMVLEPVIETSRPTTIVALASSPWSPLIAIGAPKQVLLYHAKTQRFLGALPFPEGQPAVLKFSRSGKLLLCGGGRGGANGRVVLWNVETGERVAEIGDELDTVLAADINYDQTLVALGGPQKMIRVYSTQTGELQYEIKKHTDWVTSLEFSPDGVLLATGDRNGGLHVWEASNGQEYLTLRGHTKAISGITWRIDSNILASASEDTTIRLWEMENGGQVRSWGAHGGGTTGVEFARDGNLVSSGRDRIIKLWNQSGQALKAMPAMADIATAVTFCDETGNVFGGDLQGNVSLWNAADATALGQLTANPLGLEKRYAAAKVKLETAKSVFHPLQATAAQTKKELGSVQSRMTAAQTEQKQAQAKMAATSQSLEKSKADLTTATAEKQKLDTQFASTAQAHSLLQESAQKATAASQALPNNAALKKSAADLTAQTQTLANEVAGLKTQVANATEKHRVLAESVKQQTTEMTKSQNELNATNGKVAQVQKEMGPMQAKATKAESAVAAALPHFQKAEAEVKFWEQEIAFRNTMTTLQTNLVAAEKVVGEKANLAQQAEAILKEAQLKYDAAKKAEADARQKADAIRQEIKAKQNRSGT